MNTRISIAGATVVAIFVIVGFIEFMKALDRSEQARADEVMQLRQNGADAVACRQAHGIPIFSAFDGYSVKDCKPLPTVTR